MKRYGLLGGLVSILVAACNGVEVPVTDEPVEVASSEAAITVNDYARSVLVLVDSRLFSGLTNELATLVTDMQAEAWLPIVQQWSDSDPVVLKNYLRQQMSSSKGRIAGAFFIGDLPTVLADHSWSDDPTWASYAPGVSDYWYMDLDGDWRDQDGNGSFEYHADGSGDRGPELFVGRLPTSTVSASLLGKTELELAKGYLNRNHRFRKGFGKGLGKSLFVASTALETEPGFQEMLQSQQQMLPDTIVLAFQHNDGYVVEPGVTTRWSTLTPNQRRSGVTRTMFLDEFANRYNFVHVNAHGWSQGYGGLLDVYDVAEIVGNGRSLPAIINAHSCTTARIQDTDSMGAVATLGDSLAYIGAGSLMYYAGNWDVAVTQALKTKSIGEAIRSMHETAFASDDSSTSVHWQSILHLLLGDPTLNLRYPAATTPDPSFVNSEKLEVWMQGDTTQPNTMPRRLFLKNVGTSTISLAGVKARYYFSSAERPSVEVRVQDQYTPASTPSIVSLGSNKWYVELDFTGNQATLAPGASTSGGTTSGEQIMIYYSDWGSGWKHYNDYSAEGLQATWAVTGNVDVYRNTTMIYGRQR